MSETSNQLNPQQNSGAVNPNSTKVEKTEPVSPGQTATTQTANPAQTTGPSSNIAFHSAAIGTQTARPKDYFAEQNQETLTKKQAHSTRIRWLLIFSCGLVGVALVIGAIWFIITMATKSKTPTSTPEEVQQIVTATYDEAFEKAMDPATDSDTNASIGANEETINSATEIYQQALEEAHNDPSLTTELLLSQIDLYIMTGERYNEIIEIGSKIDPESLPIETRSKFYNNLAEAYWMIGNKDKANEYYNLIFELSGGETYGG